MKRAWLNLGAVLAMTLLITGAAWAEVSKDEKNLEREVKRLNDTAAKPDGEQAVVKRLVAELKATEQQIKALRDLKFGYGEIAVVLSLAQTMPGGATDANAQKILAMRQGPPVAGWGDVARQLGTKLGKTVSQVRKMANNANREIKNDHARRNTVPNSELQEQQPVQQQEQQEPRQPNTYPGEGRSLKQGPGAQ
jgi:hypothetical protein